MDVINNLDIKFIQALNPLYAVPIIAVIICAFFVYAFGFKTPAQPPSFEGFEEEKKYGKKRKLKETQKGKSNQTVKVNGNTINKASLQRKKEFTEKSLSFDKSTNIEKPVTIEKRISKGATNKKLLEKKKESFSQDEITDEGWVQLVSKRGKKSRKKGDITESPMLKLGKRNDDKINENLLVVESSKSMPEICNEGANKIETEPIQSENNNKENINIVKQNGGMEELKEPRITKTKDGKKKKVVAPASSESELPMRQPVMTPLQPLPDLITNKSDHLISNEVSPMEVVKPKKKKKKSVEAQLPEPTEEIAALSSGQSLPDMVANVALVDENKPRKKKKNAESSSAEAKSSANVSIIPTEFITTAEKKSESSENIDNVINQQLEVKPSNVAFDELAGMYPEAKESKKKKKVRRDH